MRITWHGHSFFELEADGANILIDPFLEANPATEATPDDFDADVIAVTHGHHDHAGEAHRFGAPLVCQPELAGYFGEKGAEATGMNIGGTYEEAGVEFTMTKAFHSSGAPGDGDFDRYGGTPAGFVVDDGETRFYHAGDTALFGDMKTVIRDVYSPDAAAVPMGDHFTMGPKDAATADFSFLFEVSYKYGILPVKESYSYIDLRDVNEDINSNALSVSVGVKF